MAGTRHRAGRAGRGDGLTWLVIALNTYYGAAHVAVTTIALVALYRPQASRYRRARSALAVATVAAIAGYAIYPLAPPRFVPASGLVDTLANFPRWWASQAGAVAGVSNQYAAMPSPHMAWAM